jgi:hypothetical protein
MACFKKIIKFKTREKSAVQRENHPLMGAQIYPNFALSK